MLGGGNPAGGSPATVSKNLNYVGDFCYAYSGIGTHDAGNVLNLLDFSTGAETLVVFITFDSGATSSDNMSFSVLMNNEKVMEYVITGAADSDPSTKEPRQFVIPPFTRLKCNAQRTSGSDVQYSDCMLTGRIY